VSGNSDAELAARAAGGCRSSFAMLVERHYDRIYRLAWRWSGSKSTAEDIAQDVCVKLAGAIASFRGEAAFSTWLHRIAFTTATDYLRAAQRTLSFAPSDMAGLIDAAAPDTADADLLNAELWNAVRKLPVKQRDAVLLVYGEDMSHQEAAGLMGCSTKTVSWHLHEARKSLKLRLQAVG